MLFEWCSNWIYRVLVVCFLVPKETECNPKPGWAGWISPSPNSVRHTDHSVLKLHDTLPHTAAIKSSVGSQAFQITPGIHSAPVLHSSGGFLLDREVEVTRINNKDEDDEDEDVCQIKHGSVKI